MLEDLISFPIVIFGLISHISSRTWSHILSILSCHVVVEVEATYQFKKLYRRKKYTDIYLIQNLLLCAVVAGDMLTAVDAHDFVLSKGMDEVFEMNEVVSSE